MDGRDMAGRIVMMDHTGGKLFSQKKYPFSKSFGNINVEDSTDALS